MVWIYCTTFRVFGVETRTAWLTDMSSFSPWPIFITAFVCCWLKSAHVIYCRIELCLSAFAVTHIPGHRTDCCVQTPTNRCVVLDEWIPAKAYLIDSTTHFSCWMLLAAPVHSWLRWEEQHNVIYLTVLNMTFISWKKPTGPSSAIIFIATDGL